MKRTIGGILFLCFFLTGSTQEVFQREKRDYIWLIGYGGGPTVLQPAIKMDFHHSPVWIGNDPKHLDFDAANANISDHAGNLLFYTNNIAIHNHLNELMENGDGLNPDPFTNWWVNGGYIIPQSALILPYPENSDQYYLLHNATSIASAPVYGSNYVALKFYYSLVDMAANGGAGKVVEKNILVIQDSIDHGKIVATRHANGRDWWILSQRLFSNRYYRLLLTPEGLTADLLPETGTPTASGLGQAVFSPDGSRYVHFTTYNIQDGQYLDIYDFERCSGLLSNPVQIRYNDTAFCAGVAISPNSRFLYVSSFVYVYQYDLWAADIEASRQVIAVYDGFGSPPPFSTTFFLGQLAPDDKIYISSNNGVQHMHVIHNPNAPFPDCQMEQHGIALPAYYFGGLPNHPYYGLGPEDGSPCDTLGIDHHPQADFRYVTESAMVNFYDYSRFFPTSWHWTFGDGGSSTERDPVHSYAQSGIYEVCLVVSNGIASDTLCQEVEIVVTDARETGTQQLRLKVFPNPAADYVTLQIPHYSAEDMDGLTWTLYDAPGRRVRHVSLQYPGAQTVVNLDGISAGMYVWQLQSGRTLLETGKLIVVE